MDNDLLRGLEYARQTDNIPKWWEYLVALYTDDPYNTYRFVKDFRSSIMTMANANPSIDLYEYIHKSYLLTGPYVFDDFMIGLEYNRAPEERFWLPRRMQLLPVCQLLQDLADDRLDELFISMPPRVGKSTLVMMFQLWMILRDPEKSNLYCSFSSLVAGVFYEGLLEILQDPYTYDWISIFPNRNLISTDGKEHTFNIDRRKRYPTFTSRSIDGTLNGACDATGITIADDLVSGIEEAMSPDRLENLWRKVDNDYLTRGKPGTKRLWIGTRWSIADPAGRRIDLLTNDAKFKDIRFEIVNVPALNENDESNFNYKFNVGFNTEYYRQRRASFERSNDMASWLAQYMGTPIEREGTVFNPQDLRYYNGELPEGDPDRIFMAIDPAWGGGDFVAGPVVFQYGDDLFVHDVVYSNEDKKVTQPIIVSLAIKYGVQAISVEATRTTASYTEGINSELKAQGYRVNVMSSTKSFQGTGKEQRIFDKAPDIKEQMVFLASGHRSKEYELFMQNVFAFKFMGKNKHDDAPDSLAMAMGMLNFRSTKVELCRRPF